ncbi:hypothetical protein [Rossellomorea sp. LjRoot5]|uniref:hypothetical protein n=1 Tax=Rossellomorea sp. LjRoot5 TaxID=3342331 RepID=UPI003ECDC13A
MCNNYLKRINLYYNELIVTNRLKFDGEHFYVRSNNSKEWNKAKVYKGDTISASTSLRTSLPLANARFMFANPGPYTIEQLVNLAYDGELLKYYGHVRGFWTHETRTLYFELLRNNNIPLHEHSIKDTHTAFYKSVRLAYKGTRRYHQFLVDMGVNPDEISGMKNVGKFLSEGRHIESKIIELLKEFSAPYEYGHRLFDNLIPDLYNTDTCEAIDIKRHIKTGIKKEEEKYIEAFSKVTVIYLLGSRTKESNSAGIRRTSIFNWIREEEFFVKLNKKQQESIINRLERLVEDINQKQAEQDRFDFHKKLVERIIKMDKAGYNNPEIAKELGFTYKYVNRILVGKALKEYSGDYPEVYNARQELNRLTAREKMPSEVKRLTLQGLNVKVISVKLGISTDMVKYHLRNLGLNEKVVIQQRNNRLIELFSTKTHHSTLKIKFEWIIEQLIEDYPLLKIGAVKSIYYEYMKEYKNTKLHS